MICSVVLYISVCRHKLKKKSRAHFETKNEKRQMVGMRVEFIIITKGRTRMSEYLPRCN
jgi:hypothetical protein